jgi:hypothetical protein
VDRTAVALAVLSRLPVTQTETAKRVLSAAFAVHDEIDEIDLTPGQYREHLRILTARRMRADGLDPTAMCELFLRVVNELSGLAWGQPESVSNGKRRP